MALISESAIAEPPTHDCTTGCRVVTCGETTCYMNRCSSNNCTVIVSWERPDQEFEGPDGATSSPDVDSTGKQQAGRCARQQGEIISCSDRRCTVKVCSPQRCTLFGIGGGKVVRLGTLDNLDTVFDEIASDFLDDASIDRINE